MGTLAVAVLSAVEVPGATGTVYESIEILLEWMQPNRLMSTVSMNPRESIQHLSLPAMSSRVASW